MDSASTALVARVLEAAAQRNWDELKFVLHPYLHWSEDGGTIRLRGRTNVLHRLMERDAPLARPNSVELRDGQIHRWIGGE